jgi:hypothetical protein
MLAIPFSPLREAVVPISVRSSPSYSLLLQTLKGLTWIDETRAP